MFLGTRFNPYIVSYDPIEVNPEDKCFLWKDKVYGDSDRLQIYLAKIAQGFRASYCESKFVWVKIFISLEDWSHIYFNYRPDTESWGTNKFDYTNRIIYSFKPTQAEKEYYEKYVKKEGK